MTERERFELKEKIIKRAEDMGIVDWREQRFNRVMDLDFADKQFNLRLDLFLNADDENFAHDWCGIYNNINRETCMVENCFLPRFAGVCHKRKEEIA